MSKSEQNLSNIKEDLHIVLLPSCSIEHPVLSKKNAGTPNCESITLNDLPSTCLAMGLTRHEPFSLFGRSKQKNTFLIPTFKNRVNLNLQMKQKNTFLNQLFKNWTNQFESPNKAEKNNF